MTKKIFMVTMAVLALFLSACSEKKPKPSVVGNINDVVEIPDKTVSIDENAYDQKNVNDTHASANNESNSNVLNESTTVNSSANGFKSLYFGFGDYGVAPSMDRRMSINKNIASRNNAKIKIEGNCDEFGTDEYNYALGLKRAKAVKDNMVAQGIKAQRMIIVSFGESNPVCSSPTDGCYAQNRRVDLRLAK